MNDPKARFGNRVEDYKQYRPSYPPAAIEFVKKHCSIDASWNIADIGSGTGISTQVLLDVFKCPVYAVEPNANMRQEADRALGTNHLYHSINGSSEATTLPGGSIDMAAAFQAFHWFDKVKTRLEFRRILRNRKWILLVWNDRTTKETDFLEGYESILAKLPEYKQATHKNHGSKDIREFIGNADLAFAEFTNVQQLDFEGLKGRFFSTSYAPARGAGGYEKFSGNLEKLFDRTNCDGQVTFLYTTQVFLGKMA